MRIKICGLHNEQNLREILQLSPDYIGLNFYQESKRYCKFGALPEFDYAQTKLVGVFVNCEIKVIKERAKSFKLSLIQLHGQESISDLEAVRNELPECKIIKAFGVDEEIDLEGSEKCAELSDYILFDKKTPSFGGSGQKFNWDLLQRRIPDKNFFLAGGIGPEDARPLKTLAKVVPELFAIDINSRFENKYGLKDVAAIAKFIEELRA